MAEMSQGENPVGGAVCGGNGVVPKLYNFTGSLPNESQNRKI